MSTSAADYNAKLIDEFRANDGRVGGVWEGTPLLLLHNTSAKSGASRVNPVGYLRDAPRYLIFASNGGAASNPDWYHNLKAQPNARIEVGRETIDVVAEEATGEERERLFARGADRFPDLAKYARTTDRVVPVIVLMPLGGTCATMDAADERILLAEARAGDERAFGRLASRHRPGLELYCQLMLGCPHHAHEAVCESLLCASATWIASRRQRPRGSGSKRSPARGCKPTLTEPTSRMDPSRRCHDDHRAQDRHAG